MGVVPDLQFVRSRVRGRAALIPIGAPEPLSQTFGQHCNLIPVHRLLQSNSTSHAGEGLYRNTDMRKDIKQMN